jgi:hypothetical protein
MAVAVTLFNASSLEISVSVNLGPQIAIPPTSDFENWAPQSQDPDDGPSYVSGMPAPNALGNSAPNQIQAYVSGSPVAVGPFNFSIPAGKPFGSIQIYVFFLTVQACSWLALMDGKPFAQVMNSIALPHETTLWGPSHGEEHRY